MRWGPRPPCLPTCVQSWAGDSQVCDIVHDGEAFDGVALAVDEVVVDLEAGRCMSSQRGGWVRGPGAVRNTENNYGTSR